MFESAEERVPGLSPILLLEPTILLVLWLFLIAWQRNFHARARRLFLGLTLACAVWCLGDICHHAALLDPSDANRISFIGVFAFPCLWLGLAVYTADLKLANRAPWLTLLLLAPCAAIYPLLFLDSWSQLTLSVDGEGTRSIGPVLWGAAVYAWTLIAIASGLFVVAALRSRGVIQWLLRLGVALTGFAALAVNVASLHFGIGAQLEPTPIALAVALLVLHFAIFAGGLLNTLPIAQLDLLSHMPIPIFVTDRHGAVIVANLAARARLGPRASRVLWRSVDEALAELADPSQLTISPILVEGREVAQIVLLVGSPELNAAAAARSDAAGRASPMELSAEMGRASS